MCGRYAVTTDPALLAVEMDAINEVSAATDGPGVSYNVAPTTTVMSVVKRHSRDDPEDTAALRVRAMRWGLVPPWTKELAKGPLLLNARAESVAEKAAFKSSLKSRRCLIPMDGWFEWRADVDVAGKKIKTPFYMSPADRTRLFMGGLWATWRNPQDGTLLMSTTIITTESVGALVDIHDRMPLIMPYDAWDSWLDPDRPAPSDMLAPPDTNLVEAITIREVSPLVNSVKNDSPELIEPAPPTPIQDTLL